MGIYIDSIRMQSDCTLYLEVTKDGKVYAQFVKDGTVMRIRYANGEPVKAVEIDIVRCKDCKCWTEWSNGIGSCSRFALDWIGTDADDFCSMGERKDND